jgi:hypothetical protein
LKLTNGKYDWDNKDGNLFITKPQMEIEICKTALAIGE